MLCFEILGGRSFNCDFFYHSFLKSLILIVIRICKGRSAALPPRLAAGEELCSSNLTHKWNIIYILECPVFTVVLGFAILLEP